MPAFTLDRARPPRPVEEVWKLVTTRRGSRSGGRGSRRSGAARAATYTMWPTGYPDFPMAQQLRSARGTPGSTISCLVSDLQFRWQLSELGADTGIEVRVELPEAEAHRLPVQRGAAEHLAANLTRLAAAAVVLAGGRRRAIVIIRRPPGRAAEDAGLYPRGRHPQHYFQSCALGH